jgi:hypothetical protein
MFARYIVSSLRHLGVFARNIMAQVLVPAAIGLSIKKTVAPHMMQGLAILAQSLQKNLTLCQARLRCQFIK